MLMLRMAAGRVRRRASGAGRAPFFTIMSTGGVVKAPLSNPEWPGCDAVVPGALRDWDFQPMCNHPWNRISKTCELC